MNSFDSFTLTPMSAGDVIDRAVRLYRRNFLALLRIVFGPSLVAYIGTVIYYIGIRNFSFERGESRVVLSLALVTSGFGIWLFGKAAFYAVLGGASRSLVDHFFEGKPILARDVYRVVKERFWSLIGAMLVIGLLLMGAGAVVYFFIIIVSLIAFAVAAFLSGGPAWLQTTLTVTIILLAVLGLAGALLILYSRVVYVPQVMMVEGKGVFDSISRSFSLAGGGLMRIVALLLFWIYVAWSAWVLLFVPLGSIAYWLGIDPMPFNQNIPIWYSVAYQTITQVSEILIAPIAMLGFTLLYLDSRVRKEGFDVELLANRLLPATPQMSQTMLQPQPIFFGSPVIEQSTSSAFPSILGLNDYSAVKRISAEHSNSPEPEIDGHFGEQVQPEEIVNENKLAEANPASPQLETLQAGKTPVIPLPAESGLVEAKLKSGLRSCRWCGTSAGDEDRFCRVCGSVF